MINFFKYCQMLFFYFFSLTHIPFSNSQEITFKNGTKYIANKTPVQSETPNIELQLVRVYGGLDAAAEETILYYPEDVVVDKNNNLFILDREASNVKVYGPDGNFLKKIGNKGQGPGEFLYPIGIDIDKRNNLYISDFQRRCIHVITSNGKYIRSIYPKHAIGFPKFKVKNNGNLICGIDLITFYRAGKPYDKPVMHLYDQKGNFLKGFGEIEYFEDQAVCKRGNAVCFCMDPEENIYVTYRFQNRIEKYSPQGDLFMQIIRKLPYKISKNAKMNLKIRPNGVVAGFAPPTMNIFSIGISIDNKDRIWVLTFSRQPKYQKKEIIEGLTIDTIKESEKNYTKLEIFNKDGILIDEIPLDEALTPHVNCLYIKQKRLFITNANDVSVTEYRIIN